MPVVLVSFYDSIRFANWLHNGQGSGDTETGYTLLGGTATPSNGDGHAQSGQEHLSAQRERVVQGGLLRRDRAAATSYFDYPAGVEHGRRRARLPTAAANTRQLRCIGHGSGGRRRRRPDGSRLVRGLGEPARHVRPGRQRLGVERGDHQRRPRDPRRDVPQRRGLPLRVATLRPQPEQRERHPRVSRREAARAACSRPPDRGCAGGRGVARESIPTLQSAAKVVMCKTPRNSGKRSGQRRVRPEIGAETD